MIQFKEHILDNGLTLITHEDDTTPLVVVNVLYKVGSRNESPERTGFAHLFEHLMFGGSKHVPDYDKSLQQVGAENNAFTNTDITNYYVILGAENIETALWTESDRMQFLTLDQKNLDTQKQVVIEEFKQRYLNVPYGDVWLKLRPLAYKTHPYKWPTIGMSIDHIERATLGDVQEFHETFYTPGNAVLTISGNIKHEQALQLTEKWFGSIPDKNGNHPKIKQEPIQRSSRFLEVKNNVPINAIYKAYHMPGRGNRSYLHADLLSDLLGRGKSSRLHQSLVKKKKVFNNMNAYILGTADPGLLVLSGKINPGIEPQDAEQYINEEVQLLKSNLKEEEVSKVINQAESSAYFSETELLNRSITLSIANSIGNTNLVNEELAMMRETTKKDILDAAQGILNENNCNTMHYLTKE